MEEKVIVEAEPRQHDEFRIVCFGLEFGDVQRPKKKCTAPSYINLLISAMERSAFHLRWQISIVNMSWGKNHHGETRGHMPLRPSELTKRLLRICRVSGPRTDQSRRVSESHSIHLEIWFKACQVHLAAAMTKSWKAVQLRLKPACNRPECFICNDFPKARFLVLVIFSRPVKL